MPSPNGFLPFEKEIFEMEESLAKLESKADGQIGAGDEVRRIKKELTKVIQKIYSNLTAWETVQVPASQQAADGRLHHPHFRQRVNCNGDRAIGD